jgi:hypothetical protein
MHFQNVFKTWIGNMYFKKIESTISIDRTPTDKKYCHPSSPIIKKFFFSSITKLNKIENAIEKVL